MFLLMVYREEMQDVKIKPEEKAFIFCKRKEEADR
jgi:hypothetical protein